jgi:hypothetical protein
MLESMSAVLSYTKGGHAPPSGLALRAQRAGSWGLHHDVADLACVRVLDQSDSANWTSTSTEFSGSARDC